MASWSTRRQFYYFSGVVIFFIAVFAFIIYLNWPQPSCTNNKKDDNELGVDCGGVCKIACLSQVEPLKVHWVRVFEVMSNKYDAVALLENTNAEFGAKTIKYNFRLYDERGVMVTSRQGTTYVNPQDTFIIYEGGINTGKRGGVVKAQLDMTTLPLWEKMNREKPRIVVEQTEYVNEPMPRLRVLVSNNSLIDLENVDFYAILSDSEGNVMGASATLLDELPRDKTRELFFTWPKPLPENPTRIDIYPRLNFDKLKTNY
jgi:hypothetical protein